MPRGPQESSDTCSCILCIIWMKITVTRSFFFSEMLDLPGSWTAPRQRWLTSLEFIFCSHDLTLQPWFRHPPKIRGAVVIIHSGPKQPRAWKGLSTLHFRVTLPHWGKSGQEPNLALNAETLGNKLLAGSFSDSLWRAYLAFEHDSGSPA